MDRRRFLGRAAAIVVLPFGPPFGPASATADAMAEAIKKVVGDSAVTEGRVALDMPPLIENGNTVPLVVSVESPMTVADHVKAIHVFNEKNPQPNVFSARLSTR
ncbi:MAG: thiosulfate oxidation carrier protein SoxY, partial [Reyranella sp.]|nr:thiosulfate oxidation carrier protein SoxY [Reyranella sp.]